MYLISKLPYIYYTVVKCYNTFITSVRNGVKVQVIHAICTFRCILNEWIYYQIP
jgi:hypothetical protein